MIFKIRYLMQQSIKFEISKVYDIGLQRYRGSIDYQVQEGATEKWTNHTRRHKCQI